MLNMTLYLAGKAFEAEYKRWGMQVNDTNEKRFEVFREGDDGVSAPVETLRYQQDAVSSLDALRAQASARAMLVALAQTSQTD